MGLPIFINPFEAKEIAEGTAKKYFFKVNEVQTDEVYETDKPLFITTIRSANKSIDGTLCSPLLTESQVTTLQDTFKDQTVFIFFLFWGFTVLPLSLPLVLITGINPMVFNVFGILLLCIAFIHFYKWLFCKEKVSKELLHDAVLVPIPDGCRKQSIVQDLSRWAGPIACSMLTQSIDLTKSQELKIIHNSFEIGNEVVKLTKKSGPINDNTKV